MENFQVSRKSFPAGVGARKSWKQGSSVLLKHRFNSFLIAIHTALNGSPQMRRRVNKQHICLGQRSEGEALEVPGKVCVG